MIWLSVNRDVFMGISSNQCTRIFQFWRPWFCGGITGRRGIGDSSSHTEMEAPPKRGKFKGSLICIDYLGLVSKQIAVLWCQVIAGQENRAIPSYDLI
jgi:hypothetical protein